MIEARTNGEAQSPKGKTPEVISTSMILEDLENGIDRNGIKEKYNLQAWEVKQMFEHPVLKGKKARKVKKMSFTFVDDTTTVDPNQTSIPVETKEETDALNAAYQEEIEGRIALDAQDQNQAMREANITDFGSEESTNNHFNY